MSACGLDECDLGGCQYDCGYAEKPRRKKSRKKGHNFGIRTRYTCTWFRPGFERVYDTWYLRERDRDQAYENFIMKSQLPMSYCKNHRYEKINEKD